MQGNEVIVYLQNEYLPSLNVPPHIIQVKLLFCFFLLIYVLFAVTQNKYLLCQVMLQQVQEAEIKTLKPYLKVLTTKTSFLILSVEFTRAKINSFWSGSLT